MFFFSLELENLDEGENFTKIMKTYGDDVLRVAYIYVKDRQRSEDICQDVFVKALTKKAYFFPEDKQKAWLMKVTINTCKTHLKNNLNKNVKLDNEILDRSLDNKHGNEIEGRIIQKERNESIVQAIYELPEKYKEIIILYYYQEYDTTRISNILGLPKGTVKSRFTKARQLLSEKIAGVWQEQGNLSLCL